LGSQTVKQELALGYLQDDGRRDREASCMAEVCRRWRGGRSNASSRRKKALEMGCRSETEEERYRMRGGRGDAGGQDGEKIREGKLL